jgi:hypothetical protein
MMGGGSGESFVEIERQTNETNVIARLERDHWGRDLKCFVHEGATKQQCDAYSGIVQVGDQPMKQQIPQAEEDRQTKKLRFTKTITVSEYIVNACASANRCTHPLPRPFVVGYTSILNVPRYGGGGFVASDRDVQHVADMGTLMLAMQEYNADGDVCLAKDVYTEALRGAKQLWRWHYYLNNQPPLVVEEAEVLQDVEMVDAEGCFDFDDVAADDDDDDEIEDGVVEPALVDALEADSGAGDVANDAEDPFNQEYMDAVMKELEDEGMFDLEVNDVVVEDGVVEPVLELDSDEDADIIEPAVVDTAIASVSEIASVDDDLGSMWVVPDDSRVRVRRSRRVVAASDTLGSCWLQLHGRTIRRSRRLR